MKINATGKKYEELKAIEEQRPEIVSRLKITKETQKDFKSAYKDDDVKECVRVLFEIVSGIDVED